MLLRIGKSRLREPVLVTRFCLLQGRVMPKWTVDGGLSQIVLICVFTTRYRTRPESTKLVGAPQR